MTLELDRLRSFEKVFQVELGCWGDQGTESVSGGDDKPRLIVDAIGVTENVDAVGSAIDNPVLNNFDFRIQ